MRVGDEAEAHWEHVSRATQVGAHWRSADRRSRRRRRRVRSGLALVRLGLRLAEPLDADDVAREPSPTRAPFGPEPPARPAFDGR